ncbi:MAG: hypothetical protein ACLTTU_11875 [Bilophila wadsworthia]
MATSLSAELADPRIRAMSGTGLVRDGAGCVASALKATLPTSAHAILLDISSPAVSPGTKGLPTPLPKDGRKALRRLRQRPVRHRVLAGVGLSTVCHLTATVSSVGVIRRSPTTNWKRNGAFPP